MSKRYLVVIGAIVLALSGLAAPPSGASVERCRPWTPLEVGARSFVVPDVSDQGQGAYVSRVSLTNTRTVLTYQRPVGVIDFPHAGDQFWSAEVCVVVPPDHPPIGELIFSAVEGDVVGLFGYAYDIDTTAPTSVRLEIDGRLQPQTWYADRPWTPAAGYPPEATDRSYVILVPQVPPGEHLFCVYLDYRGGMDVPESCARLVVK